MSIESQDPERHVKVPYPLLSPGTSHSLCLNVTSVWECAASSGNPLPSPDSRLLERSLFCIQDIWNEEESIFSLFQVVRESWLP